MNARIAKESRELLPARLEAQLAALLGRLSARFSGALASLVKKELRLQQISLLLAAAFALVALAASVLVHLRSAVGRGLFGAVTRLYRIVTSVAG